MAEWLVEPVESLVAPAGGLSIKDEHDYWAFVRGGQQRRTRSHERLIRLAVERLQARGAKVSTPHPIDLRMSEPVAMIIEAKVIGRFNPVLVVRAAVGQLFEYRSFVGPKQSELCVLVDADPGRRLVEYLEEELGVLVIWLTTEEMCGGPRTAAKLQTLSLTLPVWVSPSHGGSHQSTGESGG
jgi:hypothetical protein